MSLPGDGCSLAFYRGPYFRAGLSAFLGFVHGRIRFAEKLFNGSRRIAIWPCAYGKGEVFEFLGISKTGADIFLKVIRQFLKFGNIKIAADADHKLDRKSVV